ncbi:MAG: hypothetical protein ILO68_00135, partial [Clostridia bacterium]|nr:hypothetical protein [Clostridia bacterium]
MTGWILHNHFYYPPKFREQTDLYVSAAEREGVSLEPVSNAEAAEKTADFLRTGSGRPDFILFLDKD